MGWRRPAVCAWDGEAMVTACSVIKTREARFHFRAPKRVPVIGRGGEGSSGTVAGAATDAGVCLCLVFPATKSTGPP